MNFEQANAIPLTEILRKLNLEPVKENEKEAWYLCPWRDELTASFHVNKQRNICFDFGDWIGGNPVKFISILLKTKSKPHSPEDARNVLGQMHLEPSFFSSNSLLNSRQPKWLISTVEPLEEIGLVRYLEKRGISIPIAKKHVSDVHVMHSETKRKLWAIGFKNDDGGYELRNPFFKSCVAPKTITFIRGTDQHPDEIHFFEGFMDYLSYLTKTNSHVHPHDVIVLNSVGMVVHAKDHFIAHNYKKAFTWLDNNAKGDAANVALFSLFKSNNIKPEKMNKLYQGFDDVNEWHENTPNLKL